MYQDILRITEGHSTFPGKMAGVVLNPCAWAVACYRLSHWLWKNDVVLLPRLLSLCARMVSGIEIAPSAEIGPGLLIVHGAGLTIEGGVTLGAGCTLFQGVGIGRRFSSQPFDGVPTLGRNVAVYAGAMVIGPVKIGDDCRIGANSVVTRSFSEETTIAGVPARSIGKHQPPSTTAAEGTVIRVEAGRRTQPASLGACACQPDRGAACEPMQAE